MYLCGTIDEWIELENRESRDIDLVGWILEDSSGHAFLISKSLPNTTIALNGFYTLDYTQTKISLNNTSDSVVLKRPDGQVADQVFYSDVSEGKSYARFGSTLKVTDSPTKNASNVMTTTEQQTTGSGQWLTSDNDQQKNNQEPTNIKTSELSNSMVFSLTPVSLKDKVRLSEVLPNPEGDDEELEWIEIENMINEEIHFEGVRLKDKTSENILPTKVIPAKTVIVYQRPEFSLTLNNGDESLQLIDGAGLVVDNVSYADSEEGVSYSRVGEKWIWTEPTKSKANKESRKHEISKTNEDSNTKTSSSSKKTTPTNITTSGIVLVRPGVFGKTIVYISGEERNHQVYFQKGDWPELVEGQTVEVRGQTSAAGDVPRIKIQSPEQIKILLENLSIDPEERTIEELSEDDIGGLFRISGEMLESSGNALTIGDETGELEVYFKSSEVKKPTFQQGKPLEVMGILVKSSKGIRLLPRYPEDLGFSSSNVLGESDELPSRTSRDPWKVVGGIVLIAGVVGYSFRQRILERYEKWKVSKQPINDSFEE